MPINLEMAPTNLEVAPTDLEVAPKINKLTDESPRKISIALEKYMNGCTK